MRFLALALVAIAGVARAEWSAHLQVESFRWTEKVGPPDLTETGGRFGVGAGWQQAEGTGFRLRYRGTAYAGSVNQKSQDPATGQSRQGKTDYSGIVNELQAVYRAEGESLHPMAGIGVDYWKRTLPFTRREQDWSVVFARFGLEAGAWANAGWSAAAGIKFPLWTSINAHFVEAGFNSNPSLEPPGALRAFAEMGYRFGRRWKMSGYYDGYRFGQSPDVRITPPPTTANQPRSALDTFGGRLHYFF